MKWGIPLLLLLLAPYLHAQEFNAGFVQGLWYSEEVFFADDTVRVYVALRNNTGSDLTGTVEFFDNEKRIGRSTVSALDGRIIESWVDWEPTYGEHSLSASLTKIELHTVGERTEAVEVRSSLAEDVVFVDHDTDDDNIGNEVDADDDGDGISDVVELKNGTDPLTYNEPEENAADQGDETDTITSETTTPASATTTGEGLEQFLTPSRADSMLSAVTRRTQELKKQLDEYRAERNAAAHNETNGSEIDDIEVNQDGFGEITRTSDKPEEEEKEDTTKHEKPDGFMGDLFSFIGTIFGGLYTAALAVFSWTLGYPILIQLLLLFGILYGLYKVSKKLGGRPQ